MDQLVSLGVPPAPVYKGSKGGAAGQEEGAPGGVLLPPGVGFPPFPSWNRIREVEKREREGGGVPAPSLLVLFGLGGGACGPARATSPLLIQQGREGVLLPVGVGLLLARPPPGQPHLPLLLYIRGQGAPLDPQVDACDHILSRVRCPLPP